jgi:hypothetical protein
MANPFPSSPWVPAEPPLPQLSDLELAQALASRLAIPSEQWHQLNRNRRLRAQEQLAAALVFLLREQPEEALLRVEQAAGWLNRSLTAPPCPSHGHPPRSHGEV